MSAPGALDPRAHYARPGGLSDMERKMQMMVGAEADGDDGSDEAGPDGSEDAEAVKADGLSQAGPSRPLQESSAQELPPSPLAALPIELVERILAHAVEPTSAQVSEVDSTNDAMRLGIALGHAAVLCLVSRQFDALVRPRMYRRIQVVHRKTRALLRTLESSARLASYVRDLTLDSRIWTSDVNEDTIARIFVAVRESVISLRVGANESALLPYLFHGNPQDTTRAPAAVQALHICWRDEVDFDPRFRMPRRRGERRTDQQAIDRINGAELGEGNDEQSDEDRMSDVETDDDAVRDTLRSLFEHDSGSSVSKDARREATARALVNLEHLTLDVYTHAQLAQLFLAEGYFVLFVLPQLRLLRIELPLAVLQFATPQKGILARQWPCKRGRSHSRNIEFMLDDRIEQNRSATVDHVQQQRQQSAMQEGHATSGPRADAARAKKSNEEEIVLAPCANHQLKALLMRFALNVHRNDTTLFKVLLAPTRALDLGPWSSRAAIAAYCLKATFEKRLSAAAAEIDGSTLNGLSLDKGTASSSAVVFSLSTFQAQGVPRFWRTQWDEADAIHAAYMPSATATSASIVGDAVAGGKYDGLSTAIQATDGSPHVSILLKWPNAQEAFFHHNAMI